MAGTVGAARKPGKSGRRQLAGKHPPSGGLAAELMRQFRARFPNKTAIELALRTGADIKHCEKCLAGTRALGADFQASLLRSDFGKDALAVIMSGSDAPWWRGYRRHLEISDLRRAQAAAAKRLEALERDTD